MNVALLFFLLLIPLSGFIAWAGDRIGHKSGKKRHTLFGLRPRHTATLITVAAGMCISLVTFGLMWASNATFRIILARGEELVHTNADLKQENDDIRKQVSDKRGEIQNLDKQVETYRDQAQQAAREKLRAEDDYAKAEANSQRVKASLAEAQAHLTETQARLDKTGSDLTEAEQQVKIAQSDLHKANLAYQLADARRHTAEKAQEAAQQAAQKAQQQLAKAESDFKAVTTEQYGNLQRQQKLLAEQAGQITEQKTQIASQEQSLADLNKELDSRRHELASLRNAVQDFRTTNTALRARQITYRVGEEVDRVSIPAGTNVWRIEFILDSLLNSAGKKAESRGAGRLAQTTRAVALAPRPAFPIDAMPRPGDSLANANPPTPAPSPTPASPAALQVARGPNAAGTEGATPNVVPLIAESDLIRAAAQAIRLDNKDVVVIAVAAVNSVAGEPVPVDIRTFHNPVVLTSGTEIGEVIVDGTASRQEIVDALYGFLRNEVRTRLLKAGVIPTLTDGNLSTGVVATSSESDPSSIVTLSGDAWLKILDDIRKAGSRARVIVRIDKTSRAADPVALRFDVKRSSDSQDLPSASRASSSGGSSDSNMALR